MTATDRRNRIHMPVAFDPAAYTYVGAFDADAGDPGARGARVLETYTRYGVTVQAFSPVGADRAALSTLLAQSSTSRYNHDRGQQCDHCGAHIRYVAVLRHLPTGDHVASGEQCLSNRFALQSKAQFDALRRASAEERAEQRIVASVTRFLDAHPDLRAILWPVPEQWQGTRAYDTLTDIARKLRRYGDLSERQVAFVRRLPEQAAQEQQRTAQRAQERAEAAEAPEGRVHVEGVVVGRKLHDSMYGSTWKLTVRHDSGYRVWVTEPSAVECGVGDRVAFDAQLSQSDNDETFAFGKRPTRFVVSERAEQ